MDQDRIADILKLGTKAREASYDLENQRYKLSTMEACVSVSNPSETKIAWIIGLALDGWWNDALDWADNPHNGT